VARDLRVELAALLARGDDAAEQAQKIRELRVLVLLHELARLAELDRQHLGGSGLVGDQLQVAPDERAQLRQRRLLLRDLRAQLVVDLVHPRLEQRDQQVVLVLEVEVDRAVGDPGVLRDLRHPRGEKPALGEHALGGLQDPLALVAAPVRR
jgi:hypothetical protein